MDVITQRQAHERNHKSCPPPESAYHSQLRHLPICSLEYNPCIHSFVYGGLVKLFWLVKWLHHDVNQKGTRFSECAVLRLLCNVSTALVYSTVSCVICVTSIRPLFRAQKFNTLHWDSDTVTVHVVEFHIVWIEYSPKPWIISPRCALSFSSNRWIIFNRCVIYSSIHREVNEN